MSTPDQPGNPELASNLRVTTMTQLCTSFDLITDSIGLPAVPVGSGVAEVTVSARCPVLRKAVVRHPMFLLLQMKARACPDLWPRSMSYELRSLILSLVECDRQSPV